MTEDKNQPPVASPYSKATLHLCRQIEEAKSKEERAQLMLQLASRYHLEHDPTDADLNDQYHSFFEEYEHARMAFQQSAFRLARLAMSEVQGAFESGRLTPEESAVVGKAVN
jgi:hypothetical protein